MPVRAGPGGRPLGPAGRLAIDLAIPAPLTGSEAGITRRSRGSSAGGAAVCRDDAARLFDPDDRPAVSG
ncbi:hypothetical protein GCM10020218_011190 [Dactylosporangium vinaceum]